MPYGIVQIIPSLDPLRIALSIEGLIPSIGFRQVLFTHRITGPVLVSQCNVSPVVLCISARLLLLTLFAGIEPAVFHLLVGIERVKGQDFKARLTLLHHGQTSSSGYEAAASELLQEGHLK